MQKSAVQDCRIRRKVSLGACSPSSTQSNNSEESTFDFSCEFLDLVGLPASRKLRKQSRQVLLN